MTESTEAAATGGGLPATETEEHLWFREKVVPGSTSHTLAWAFLVRGPLDVAALRSAWLTVASRHEALRTSFTASGPRLVRRVTTVPSPDVSTVEVRDAGGASAEGTARADIARWAAGVAAVPLDGDGGPLARLTLGRLAPTAFGVVLRLHRLVAGEDSAAVVLAELSEAYADTTGAPGAATGAPATGSTPARRHGAGDEESLSWWTSALRPLPPRLSLPVDRPRQSVPDLRAAAVCFAWDRELGRALENFAAAGLVGPSTVVLAAWRSLLGRWGAQDTVAVGVPIGPRPGGAGAVESAPGPVPVTVRLDRDPTLRDAVAATATALRDAVRHRDVPLARILRALRDEPEPLRSPVFDTTFTPEAPPAPELWLAAAAVVPVALPQPDLLEDLALSMRWDDGRVTGTLRFRGLFDELSARAMLEQLRVLLTAALGEPDVPMGALPPGTGDTVETASSGPGTCTEDPPSVHELVRLRADTDPEAVAVDWDGRAVTYGELRRRATEFARALRPYEVAASPVVVRLATGPDQVAALLGVLEAGAHLMWLGTGKAGERGRAALTDVRPACMLTGAEGESGDGGELARWYREELGGRVVPAGGGPSTAPGGRMPPAAVPDAWAYIAHTSGSSGRPKGIAQTHAALAQFASWFGTEFGLGPGSRVAQWVAPEHDPALCEVFAALVAGATLVPVPDALRRDPERLVAWLGAERVTTIQTVPSFAREMLRAIRKRGGSKDLGALAAVLLMGEALPGELVNGFREVLPGARLANLYGPTETVAATWHEVTGPITGPVPIGLPIPGRAVVLLDEHDRPCPPGVTGEIVVLSRYVSAGYVGEGVGDGTRFRAPTALPGGVPGSGERVYRTGDLGRLRWDGTLEFRGRKDLQIKLLGNRLELAEVESLLAGHESVLECAAVPVTDGDGLAARLVFHVVPRRDETGEPVAGAKTWRAYLRARLGGSAVPAIFRTVEGRLPRTVAGKVDRIGLAALGTTRLPGPVTRTVVEAAIAEIWAAPAGAVAEDIAPEDIAPEDTTTRLGSGPLPLLHMLDRVRAVFGVTVTPARYLADPTLAGLSAVVERAVAARAVAETAVAGTGQDPDGAPDDGPGEGLTGTGPALREPVPAHPR
ncbi:hypothetical protein CFN78_17220 [Amycolatopsis antarctica]|uniref:Carrier domain-containing protein n=1 Tax=Amycolatopsis antarctica TaxID=1854586 RepID=A0A263D0C2_9PSEU|nr:non-ribosomal peptide synthetase [Amycolatopsis antarctica]OZM71894.1 hypothetical protein CFN78_17220 [Amycolatopsis antarctica]